MCSFKWTHLWLYCEKLELLRLLWRCRCSRLSSIHIAELSFMEKYFQWQIYYKWNPDGTNNSKVICTLCMAELNYHKSTISVIMSETRSVSVTIENYAYNVKLCNLRLIVLIVLFICKKFDSLNMFNKSNFL